MTRSSLVLSCALLAAACGDDGKPALYEACATELACTEGLACLGGFCTQGCVVEEPPGSEPTVGECLQADECESELLGCCLVNLVEATRGQGNCVVEAPAPTPP